MFVRPILLVKIDVVCPFVRSAQPLCVFCAQAWITVRLCSGQWPASKVDFIQSIMLFGEQIDELQISHPQKAKWPSLAHQCGQELGLGEAGFVAIFLSTKRASRWRRTTLQKFFVEGHDWFGSVESV